MCPTMVLTPLFFLCEGMSMVLNPLLNGFASGSREALGHLLPYS